MVSHSIDTTFGSPPHPFPFPSSFPSSSSSPSPLPHLLTLFPPPPPLPLQHSDYGYNRTSSTTCSPHNTFSLASVCPPGTSTYNRSKSG